MSKSDVDNPLHADQPNVELKLPNSGPTETDASTHKDARLDPLTVNASRQEEPKLATCGSFDLAPGSCYGTYCICHVHEGVVLGEYTPNRRSDEEEPFYLLSKLQLMTAEYDLSF
jgi:hypothetical protein